MTKISFWFQVIVAWFYAIPQAIKIVKGDTAGLNLAMFVLLIFYCLICVSLSILSYRKQPEKIRLYTAIIFAQWTVIMVVLLALGFQSIIWTLGDTITSLVAVILITATTAKYRGLNDPIARGWLAVWGKGLPHAWLTLTMIMAHSSQGMPAVSIWSSHLSMWPRFIQIIIAGKRGGWDRPTKGLFIGELANVSTWMIVTIIWIKLR